MSVLCCRIPNFLVALACRRQPTWAGRPLALLGPDERLWAVSPEARRYGVQMQMRPQQAQLYCPDLLLRPLALEESQSEQQAFLATVATWELPVEPQEWGVAYVDLHTVAKQAGAVQPLAAELGRRLRSCLGAALQPSLGWDSGKFTARAAAIQTTPGRMRLVDKADEVRFLSPLPVTLLPLPQPHLQQLHWLGIRTLGEFARLPATAVWQRFGAAGKLAQLWAQGRDERPVHSEVQTGPAPVAVAIDPPARLLQPVIDALMATLEPVLGHYTRCLQGVCHLRVTLCFVTGAPRTLDITFVEPASHPGRVRAELVRRIGAVPWPAAVEALQWQVLAVGELVTHQPTLFEAPLSQLVPLETIANGLAGRYGSCFFRGRVVDECHPLAERRSCFETVATASP